MVRPVWDDPQYSPLEKAIKEANAIIEKATGSQEAKVASHVQGQYPGAYQTNGMLPFDVGDAIAIKNIGPVEVKIDMAHHHVPGGSTLNIHENDAGGEFLTVPNDHTPPQTMLSTAETAALTKAKKQMGVE